MLKRDAMLRRGPKPIVYAARCFTSGLTLRTSISIDPFMHYIQVAETSANPFR
jgi:hypothetical protein